MKLDKGYPEKIWCAYREKIVYQGNLLKFSQNKNILVGAAPWDSIWGNGLDIDDSRTFDESQWLGLNLLGKILMRVREALKL